MTDSVPAPRIQQLADPQFAEAGITVSVLRLDELHPIISGNKWLKLQPWLALAKAHQKTELVTEGGPWSNHLHATAYAAKLHGLTFTAIVQARQHMMTTTLADILNWGGKIIYRQAGEGFQPTSKQLFIPMGGEGPEGSRGVSEFINALNLPAFGHVYCPIGTGTTLAGVVASNLRFGQLRAVNPGINDAKLANLVSGLNLQRKDASITMVRDTALLKFGKCPPTLPAEMNNWYARWQLPTDIIYTAKMMHMFSQELAAGRFATGDSILLIHTGGLQGNRSLPSNSLDF